MPTHDAHQRSNAATTNPFEENIPRLTEYTAQEIATLQSRLDRQLGPEYISTRPGAGGGKVHYLAAEKVINLANEVFGFNGWSSGIQNVQIDFVDENQGSGKVSLGLSVIMRVTLRDGTFHEDIGYGQIENCKGKAAAFEKAKKEAATDALKRALRNFGNVLGNCLYDKDYLSKITKIKVQPSKWDSENLHRHADYAPDKKESNDESKQVAKAALQATERTTSRPIGDFSRGPELEEDFGGNLFDEVELNSARPEEVMLPPSRPQTPRQPLARQPSGPVSHQQPSNAVPAPAMNGPNQIAARPAAIQPLPPNQQHPPQPQQTISRPTHSTPPEQTRPSEPQNQQAPQQQPPRSHEPPVGFITAKAAEMLRDSNPPDNGLAKALPKFNPNADSPSIRKTSGIDHAKSAPVSRTALGGGANSPAAPPARAGPVSFINPSENMQRRIGAPGGGMSPVSNRTQYKPPTMAAGVKRPPLADVSNTIGQGQEQSGEDTKRPRIGKPETHS